MWCLIPVFVPRGTVLQALGEDSSIRERTKTVNLGIADIQPVPVAYPHCDTLSQKPRECVLMWIRPLFYDFNIAWHPFRRYLRRLFQQFFTSPWANRPHDCTSPSCSLNIEPTSACSSNFPWSVGDGDAQYWTTEPCGRPFRYRRLVPIVKNLQRPSWKGQSRRCWTFQ